jgi:predicted nucleotidyltransferase
MLTLDIPEKYLAQVKALLHAQIPHVEVWAYGSRVNGDGHAASDLDLVLRNLRDPHLATGALGDLKEAFIESNLPIRVDVIPSLKLCHPSPSKKPSRRCLGRWTTRSS